MRAARTIFSLLQGERSVGEFRSEDGEAEEGLSGWCSDHSIELCKELYSFSSLPSLANVDHVDSVRTSLPKIRLHVNLQVLRSHVALGREEHLNVLRGWVEDWRKVCGRHDRGRKDWQPI
jgi:hypothetical protein